MVGDVSTRELMYLAATKAYADAGINPRKDVGSFISCAEDLWEGWSISDEMVPDQLGGAQRPVCTVPADAITGLGHALMHIRSGVAEVVSVEAHSKVADVLDKRAVENMALDPVTLRVPGAGGDVLAGLEMGYFLEKTGFTREDCSRAVQREKLLSLHNPRACYGGSLSLEEISEAAPIASPLRMHDKPGYAEASIVLVLASESWAKRNRKDDAVFVDGLAWRSCTPWFEGGEVSSARYVSEALGPVLRQAGLRNLSSVDLMEVDDGYSYKLLQHLLSLGLGKREVLELVSGSGSGAALNPSGGSLGAGNLLEATAAHRVLECVLQLRGRAGENQLKRRKLERALALSWRGNPTATGAVALLSSE
jgi:acetyl-CoA C-acetyltransferase